MPQARVPPGAGYWKEYKTGGYDYFLAKGYVTITPTKHFHVQFGYDNNFIGDGIRSMLLSDFGANYLFLKLNTNIWKINYENICRAYGFMDMAEMRCSQRNIWRSITSVSTSQRMQTLGSLKA